MILIGMAYTVYRIKRKTVEDNRSYIGVTGVELTTRLSRHKHGNNKKLVAWLKKYWDDIIIESIVFFTYLEDALSLEKTLVPAKQEERDKLGLLNLTEGGGAPGHWDNLSSEQQKIRKTILSEKLKGKKRSTEQKKRMSEAHKGKKQTQDQITKRIQSYIKSEKLNRQIMLISPAGVRVTEKNPAIFAKKYNLNDSLLRRLLKKKARHYQNWSLNGVPVYIVCAPNGEKYAFCNKSKFAKMHNLSRVGISHLVTKRIQSHCGWTLIKESSNIILYDSDPEHYKIYSEYLKTEERDDV
jgi:hypothetical protein